MTRRIYPPALTSGDTVAFLATSHAAPEGAIEIAADRLRSFGLEVEPFETARRDSAWLREHPRARAEDLHRAFADDGIAGIVSVMGGNTAHQLLPHLDTDLIREHPTRFFGGSDNTHLHLACCAAGVVSFYGGQAFPDLATDAEMHPYTRETVERALFETPFGELSPSESWTDEYDDIHDPEPRAWFSAPEWYWHGDGRAEGAVVGGCFEMLETQLMLDDSPFPAVVEPGDVLAVETSGETPLPAEIERFFGVLGERGLLDSLGGLVVGKPETPGGPLEERTAYRHEQRETITRSLEAYDADLPVVFDLDFGHTAPVLPLALGAEMVVDADERTVELR
jgi:muramoyltetrapeptide carboxypeptidase LdcA involved in peptidoglycan recycling